MNLHPRLLAFVALPALLAGCGSSGNDTTPTGDRPPSERLVDLDAKPPLVNALDIDPANGDFLLTTNKGFWRIDPKTDEVTQVKGTISADGKTDTVGTFLEIETEGDGRLIGSGHPDNQDTLPQFLGFIESTDSGKSWKVLARLGDADLHKIVTAHDKIYAFDAVLGAMLISEDDGKNFEERFTPRGLVIDFVVDPQDENYLLASTEDQLFKTEDGGERWRPVVSGLGMRLDWTSTGVFRADEDGTIHLSTDRGATFTPVGKVDGEPYKFKSTDDPDRLFLAMSDGTILETTDAGKSWKPVFRP